MLLEFAFLLFFISECSAGQNASYNGYKVVRFLPKSEKEVDILKSIVETDDLLIDVWRYPSTINMSVDLNLSPAQYKIVTQLTSKIMQTTTIDDVQAVIDRQTAEHADSDEHSSFMQKFNYGTYHTLEEIYSWIKKVSRGNKYVSTFTAAISTEGRPVTGIKIETPGGPKQKFGFYFQGGIHAREWISPATVLYMTGQMIENYGTDKDITNMVDRYVWYIVPVANPDGYKYSWEHDRLWRKTRSQSRNSFCVGVDPNRNWDYYWCTTGSSRDPCSPVYCGPRPFSEPEVKGIANFISRKIIRARVFIDFHAYSQLWMTPWGYTRKLPNDFSSQDEASKITVNALKSVYGTRFEHGAIANVIYEASGSSTDWAYGAGHVKFSFAVELRDRGHYGFLLPSAQIIPSGIETLRALRALSYFVDF